MDIKKINELMPAELKETVKKFFQDNLAFFQPAPASAPALTPAPATVALQEAIMADGTTVLKYNTPTLAVGSEVTVVTPEGEMPAPEGEHKLQDGTTIKVVVKEGKAVVEAITPAASPDAQVAPQLAAMRSELESFKQSFAAANKENEAITAQFKAQATEIAEIKRINGEFLSMFKQIMDLPTAEPIEPPKGVKKTRAERIADSK